MGVRSSPRRGGTNRNVDFMTLSTLRTSELAHREIVMAFWAKPPQEATLNGLIYLIGLIVVIMAILSFFGLR